MKGKKDESITCTKTATTEITPFNEYADISDVLDVEPGVQKK